jgi:prepilin-type N-terminal cleavage/methylation domain-containing protein
MGQYRRAFTLIELLVVIAIIALLIGILLPSLASARKVARMDVCMNNMRQMGVGLVNYASDARNSLAQFSWKAGVNPSQFSDLQSAGSATQAHINQALDIVRRHLHNDQPFFDGRMIARNFSYLVLVDGGYFGDGIPERAVVCPEDKDALTWQNNLHEHPDDILTGTMDPDPAGAFEYKQFLPFWSTYQAVPSSWTNQTGAGGISQASGSPGYHLLYQTPGSVQFNNVRMDQVTFPSQKVYIFDLFDRHSRKRSLFHAYPDAKQPLLFFDGSVSVRRTGDANAGWNPLYPTLQRSGPLTGANIVGGVTNYLYYPTAGEPRTLSGSVSDLVYGYYRWTRQGIKGVDFSGGEVR